MKNQKIMTSGKQLDTIVYPPNKPHYCVPGCNFLWKASGKFQWWKIKSTRKKALKNEKNEKYVEQTETRPRHNCVSWHNDTIVYPDTILQNNKNNIIKNKHN